VQSGEGSAYGVVARRGIDMAIEKINASGGVLAKQIEVNHQDDAGDPKKTISAFKQLVEVEHVKFIIGPSWSNLGIALIDMAGRSKTVMISPSLGVATFNEANKYLFNTKEHDFIGTDRLAERVYAQGYRSVALVSAEHVWCYEQKSVFTKKFEALGGKIALTVEMLPGTSNVLPEALKIKKAKNIDAVVYLTDGITAGSLVAKALKGLKFKLPMFSVILDQPAIDAAQGGYDGVEIVTSLTPDSEFRQMYETRYKEQIQVGADTAYDAVMLLARAISAAGNAEDSDAVAEKLAAIEKYDGVSGNLTSDGKRGYTKDSYAVVKVVDGKLVGIK
jgi:branched-chain amino acid transport system substrate-binding protein